MIADKRTYLKALKDELRKQWPDYRPHYIVCHGHSVVTGAFAKSQIRPFDAYPHLFHRALNEKFPTALLSVIVTAIGGENSEQGAVRFERDVLCHRPELVTIDYALNDRGIGLQKAEESWRSMIEACKARNIPVILVTPTMDVQSVYDAEQKAVLAAHAEQIRRLAAEYEVGLADAYEAFEKHLFDGGEIEELLDWVNHPSRKGHELVVSRLVRWFPMDF